MAECVSGHTGSFNPVTVIFQHVLEPAFSIGRQVRDRQFGFFPAITELTVVRMERKVASHRPEKRTRTVKDPHDHAPVVLALRRARLVDGAPDEVSIRTEEPAGCGVLI